MNKKIPLGAAISLIAIAAAITFILTSTFSLDIYNEKVQNVKERAEVYKKLDEIDTYVRNNYYGTINEEDLINAIADGYINVLGDNYAKYLSASSYQEANLEENGEVIGVGLDYAQDESGYIIITNVYSNSPAAQMGITAGEYIVAVNGTVVLTDGYDNAVKKLNGDIGTTVSLTIRNAGVDRNLPITLKRFDIQSVSGRIINNIGYIKINGFNKKTTDQFKAMINEMTNSGVKGFVFDVRNNLGGLISSTMEVLDILLPEGNIATSTDENGKTTVLGTSEESQINLPMAVIINSRTASAAELFASALRDYEKAQLVGTNSYGKGVIQKTYECLDGSAIAFTVATYQTTKTPCFDKIGLKPDYEVTISDDSVITLSLSDETTDTQLKKALAIVASSFKE